MTSRWFRAFNVSLSAHRHFQEPWQAISEAAMASHHDKPRKEGEGSWGGGKKTPAPFTSRLLFTHTLSLTFTAQECTHNVEAGAHTQRESFFLFLQSLLFPLTHHIYINTHIDTNINISLLSFRLPRVVERLKDYSLYMWNGNCISLI